MKRSFLAACVLALTLALGLSATSGASTQAEAGPAAKKGAKKGKGCKGKAGKPKAGKSAAAQAKKKGKAKGKGCKPKGKKGSKQGKNGTKVPASPAGPPPVAPPPAATLSDGLYGDPAKLLELNVSNGVTTVVLKYVPPGFCVPINYTSQPVPLTKSGDTWTASETRSFTIAGEPANVKWDLAVKEGLTYALNLTLESNSMIGFCKGEGHPTGPLTKIG